MLRAFQLQCLHALLVEDICELMILNTLEGMIASTREWSLRSGIVQHVRLANQEPTLSTLSTRPASGLSPEPCPKEPAEHELEHIREILECQQAVILPALFDSKKKGPLTLQPLHLQFELQW